MLRIDVNVSRKDIKNGIYYKIPSDNPFASSTRCGSGDGCPEIYAWGFRNPWRWSFDRKTGDLWVADVGQNAWEEIDHVDKDRNYGWRCYEGNHKYNPKGCKTSLHYVFPVTEYKHGDRTTPGGYDPLQAVMCIAA